MDSIRTPEMGEPSFARGLLLATRHHLGSRRGLLVVGGAALAAGLALNWSWLVAAGIAPVLLTALPCLAMCALGLCMNKTGGQSCSTDAGSQVKAKSQAGPKLNSNRK